MPYSTYSQVLVKIKFILWTSCLNLMNHILDQNSKNYLDDFNYFTVNDNFFKLYKILEF